MFEPSSESFVDLKKYQLLHLFHSLNEPSVSLGDGLPPQAAICHLMVLQQSNKAMEILIGLHFPESGKRIIYTETPFQAELYAERLSQAQDFVDQMGFIMDNSHFDKAGEHQRTDILRTVPFFYKDIELFYKALSTTEIKYRKWKSEASQEVSLDSEKVFLEQYLRIMSML